MPSQREQVYRKTTPLPELYTMIGWRTIIESVNCETGHTYAMTQGYIDYIDICFKIARAQ